MRPRGSPPTPSAMSRPSEPVEMVSISIDWPDLPSFMIEPLPKLRSIWESAASRALDLSMDEPSTRRRAAWAISRSFKTYDSGWDSTSYFALHSLLTRLAGQSDIWIALYTFCSRSRYVLLHPR